jgi:hypothetical protein
MNIDELIPPNAYIISAVLFIIGLILKQTPFIKNWMIPYILTLSSIIICNFLFGPNIYSSLQGILITGTTVYFHQLGKQGAEIFNKAQILQDK